MQAIQQLSGRFLTNVLSETLPRSAGHKVTRPMKSEASTTCRPNHRTPGLGRFLLQLQQHTSRRPRPGCRRHHDFSKCCITYPAGRRLDLAIIVRVTASIGMEYLDTRYERFPGHQVPNIINGELGTDTAIGSTKSVDTSRNRTWAFATSHFHGTASVVTSPSAPAMSPRRPPSITIAGFPSMQAMRSSKDYNPCRPLYSGTPRQEIAGAWLLGSTTHSMPR